MDHTKALSIMAGSDSFAGIGLPPNTVAPVQWSHWQAELTRLFDQSKSNLY